jgi:hypothetical protein
MASPTMNENAPAKLVPIHLSSRSPPQTFVLCYRYGKEARRDGESLSAARPASKGLTCRCRPKASTNHAITFLCFSC